MHVYVQQLEEEKRNRANTDYSDIPYTHTNIQTMSSQNQGMEIPQMPIPGEQNKLGANESYVMLDPSDQPSMLAERPHRSAMDIYFDNTLDYMGRHPVIAGVGAFLSLYFIAGAYRTIQIRMHGGKNVTQFLKGGFDPKMNRKEALQILNLTENNLTKKKLKEVHRRIMLANHPDKGGSPYLATKINEAKDFLEKKGNITK